MAKVKDGSNSLEVAPIIRGLGSGLQCIHKQYGSVQLLSTGTAWISLEKDSLGSKGYRYYRVTIDSYTSVGTSTNNGHCIAEILFTIDGKKAANAMTGASTGSIGPYTHPATSAQMTTASAWRAFDNTATEWEGVWSDVSGD